MKALVTFLTILAPGAGYAQTRVNPDPSMNQPNYSTHRTAVDSYAMNRVTDTPAMQRQKLTRAIALRDEAAALREANGGMLGPDQLRYLQRKADAIRAGR